MRGYRAQGVYLRFKECEFNCKRQCVSQYAILLNELGMAHEEIINSFEIKILKKLLKYG